MPLPALVVPARWARNWWRPASARAKADRSVGLQSAAPSSGTSVTRQARTVQKRMALYLLCAHQALVHSAARITMSTRWPVLLSLLLALATLGPTASSASAAEPRTTVLLAGGYGSTLTSAMQS